MTDETIVRLLGLVVLLILSGFFSGSETALLALDRMRVKYLQQKRQPGADRLATLLESPDRLLGGILVGNNLVNIAASVVATGLLVRHFGDRGEWLTILILTPVLLIISEVCPKTYAAQYPEKVSFLVLRPIMAVLWLLSPVVRIVILVSGLLTGLLRGRAKEENLPLSEDEIRSIIQVGEESGVVAAEQRRMLHGIFDLTETRVRDVMLPRTEVVGIAAGADFREILEIVRNSGHSRFPVYNESLDQIVGIIHSKDVLAFADRPEQFSLVDNCRKPFFAPESKRVGVLLQTFRKKREHLAIVVDEYGGVEGIVTLEDVVEEIVGEIHDEYDIEEVDFRQLETRKYLVDGAVSLRTVNRRFHLALPEEHVTTLAGYLLQLMGKIPAEGDRCEAEGVLFSVRRMDGRRIEEVVMTLPGSQDLPK
ncbi:MAG TPA: hemolysin family protein [Geopsychrobacteraceae bacterium]|jgi:putative hemolysin